MGLSVRTKIAFAGCFCVLIGVVAYFIYVYRIRRAASLHSRRIEDAAARFYAELLAQHERDRAARAAGEDDVAEDDIIELDVRIPFLVYLPDKSLHVALLDEELTYRASGAVASAQLSTQGERETHAPTSEPRDAEHASVAVDLPTAFTVPPSGSLTPPQGPEVNAAASETDLTVPAAAAGPSQPAAAAPGGPPTGQNAGAQLRDAPPQLFTSPVSDPPVRPDVATGDRESMSQRLWRLGSAVFSAAGDTPDTDIPTNVIWSIASVPAAFLPAAVLPPVERSSTLRGTLFRSNRSIQQLSGALGLTRAESAGSSRSFFGRSHTDAGDAALDSAYMPMDMHPEEDLSDEYSEEESAAISAYPEGVWPESSPRLRSVSGRFQRADSARSISRRGSASGRMASLSKSLSQALALPVSGRDRLPSVTPASASSSSIAPPSSAPTAAAGAAAAEQPPTFPPNAVAVVLPVM